MASFKASSSSSSRFVSVTAVLILLAVIINIYPAPAAATASLEAVEEVAKDQGTTEVDSGHHHEIRGRVLMGFGSWIPKVKPINPGFVPRYGPKIGGGIYNGYPYFPIPSPPPSIRSSFTP